MIYTIDFGGNVMAEIKVENGQLSVIRAMDGWGNPIKVDDIKTEKQNEDI